MNHDDPRLRRELIERGLVCDKNLSKLSSKLAPLNDDELCHLASLSGQWRKEKRFKIYRTEAERRKLTCGVGKSTSTKSAAATVSANLLSLFRLNDKSAFN